MKFNKKDLLDKLENEINRQLDIVVQNIQNLDNEAVLKQNKEGKWSIAQNLKHLNFYFDFYNPAIQSGLNKATKTQSEETFKSNWLGNYFSDAMDYRKDKKMKAFKAFIPEKDLNAAEVIQDFINNQEEFLRLIREARNYNISGTKIPISLTKWIKIKIGDALRVVSYHNERHFASMGFTTE